MLLHAWPALAIGLVLWGVAFVLLRAGAAALRREKQVVAPA